MTGLITKHYKIHNNRFTDNEIKSSKIIHDIVYGQKNARSTCKLNKINSISVVYRFNILQDCIVKEVRMHEHDGAQRECFYCLHSGCFQSIRHIQHKSDVSSFQLYGFQQLSIHF